MKKLLFFVVMVAALMTICQLQPIPAAPVDLRAYIDGATTYPNSDSLEFIGGTASYDGYSDTVRVTSAEFISVDFIYTRNGGVSSFETLANCYIQLQGSKDGVRFINTDSANDSIHVTAVNTTTTITFPYAPVYTYYRLYCSNDTLFSATAKWKVGGQTNAR